MTLIGALYPRPYSPNPTVGVYSVPDEKDTLYYEIPLPGFSKEGVEVKRKNGVLLINASRSEDGREYEIGNGLSKSYSKAICIEKDVEVVHAKLADGILTIKLAWQPREPPEFKIDIT